MRKNKYVNIDMNNLDVVGVCDRSGFYFNRKDLVKQMEWMGESLQWNGMLVGKPFLDEPNEQGRTIRLPADPYPVKDPRMPVTETATFSDNQMGKISSYQIPINQISSTQIGAIIKSQADVLADLQSVNFTVAE